MGARWDRYTEHRWMDTDKSMLGEPYLFVLDCSALIYLLERDRRAERSGVGFLYQFLTPTLPLDPLSRSEDKAETGISSSPRLILFTTLSTMIDSSLTP